MVASTGPEYRVIGTRPLRPDGVDKLIGRAEYGVDTHLPGMLYGRVKRSPHAHANIIKIDASRALALPGVRAVVTADDFPKANPGIASIGEGAVTTNQFQLDNFLASTKALYRGHAVAAVCATDPHIAEDALDLIDVEYEPLPVVTDVREAMAESAPVLHQDLRTRETNPLSPSPASDRPTNIAAHVYITRGDIEAGFAEADVIIEREFDTAMYHQGYIEPHNGTAYWSTDGKLTIWCSSQAIFNVRGTVANTLRIPVSRVNVIPMEIGGGFGGKLVCYLEPVAALLSQKTHRPVKMLMNRQEVFEATGPTSGTYSRIKLGARRDGSITALHLYLAFEAGAFPGSPVNGAANCSVSPYDIPNLQIDGYDVVVNRPKTVAYRAPGAPAGEFPVEVALNEMARALDLDPIVLRLRNAAKEGTLRPTGQPFGKIGGFEVMTAIQQSRHYNSEIQGPNRGRGIALGFWGNGASERSASASLNSDGTVNLTVGNVDIGGLRASMAMMLAETLGIESEDVLPRIVGTSEIGNTGPTGGSSSTFSLGWAMYELGLDLRRLLNERAAKIWECDVTAIEYGDDGVIRGPDDTEGKRREISFKQLCAQLPRSGGMISAALSTNRQSAGPAFAGHIVDLEVDPDTGKTKVLRYTAIQDVGKAIHPSYVEGQIQGAVAQGVGMALSEEYVYDKDGRMLNSSFLDYRMPTTLDMPMIETVLVEVPNPGHPFGVRGVGEVPIVPPLSAVQAAMADAIGIDFYSMPMSPRVVLEALLERREREAEAAAAK